MSLTVVNSTANEILGPRNLLISFVSRAGSVLPVCGTYFLCGNKPNSVILERLTNNGIVSDFLVYFEISRNNISGACGTLTEVMRRGPPQSRLGNLGDHELGESVQRTTLSGTYGLILRT